MGDFTSSTFKSPPREKEEKVMRSKEKSEMFRQMRSMVDEANALRDEAAEKIYAVPKAYRLSILEDEVCYALIMVVYLGFALGFMALFKWAMEGDHIGVSVFCTILLSVGILTTSVARNRSCKAEETMEVRSINRKAEETMDVYYVNECCCVALATELRRLKAGIADYDRQYEEQKEYISRFESCRAKIEKYGSGSLKLILKANDFHARVKITTAISEMNCRLLFDEDGYRRLKCIIELFGNEKSLNFSSDERATPPKGRSISF